MKNDSVMNSNQQKPYRSFRMGLALIYTLLMLFAAQTALAENSWSVEGSTSGTTTKFTIKRSDATMDENVLYRTVSLSAFEDGNFHPKEESLTFEAGETEKAVYVTEIASPSNGFKYQTSGKRSYRFEVTDEGGFYLASVDRSYSTGDSIPSTLMQVKNIAVKNEVTVTDAGYAQQAYHNIDFSAFSSDTVKSYLNYVGAELRMTLTFDAREKNDGYQYVQIYANTPADADHTDTGAKDGDPGNYNFVRYAAGFSIDGNGKETYYSYTIPVLAYGHACGKVSQPWSGNKSNLQQQYFTTKGRADDGRLILPTDLSSLYVRFNASGDFGDTWYAKNVVAHLQAVDVKAPTSSGFRMPGRQFAHGNTVYVSVPFNEIVTISGDTRKLLTSWGDLDYIDGSGSNVLTFGGTISNNATGKLVVSGHEGDIADLAGKAFNGTLSFNTTTNVTESHAYPITYDLGKGANNSGNPATYTYDNSVFLKSPSRPGCRFLGWKGSNGSTPQKSVSILAHSHGPRHYTAVWEDFWAVEQGADGTAEHPFIITTPDGLNLLAEMVNKGDSFKDSYFRLGANIDMRGVSNFTPIGISSNPFSGNFDGQGFSISNLSVGSSALPYIGFFGHIDEGASVSNIVLVDANIENKSTDGYAGAVVGLLNDASVSGNLVLGGSVKASSSNTPLIGNASGGGHYRNVNHKGSTKSNVFTLALPDGITASATPAATWEGTNYYTKGTEVTLSGATPATITGGVTYGVSYVVSYDRSDYYMADGDGKATFAMPASDVTVSTEENSNSVTYIDEDGNEQTAYNVMLIESSNGNVTLGAAGKTNWYAVTGDVVIDGKLSFDKSHTHLIICDGASLTVTANSSFLNVDLLAISSNRDITIYGQPLGNGNVTVNSEGGGIFANNITINGGNINVTSENSYGIYVSTVTINGGSINITGGEGFFGIDGGTITLGWSSLDDRIFASSYSGTVQIKNGQSFYNGSDVFSCTISDNSTLSGKTLAPYYPMVTFDAQNGSEPTTVLASYDNGDWFVTAPATPTRNGYKFLGWFTSKDGDTKFDFTDPVTQRVTVVYAKWGITYIDENGDEQTVSDYTLLTSNMSLSDFVNGSWFVVASKLSLEIPTAFSGDAHLILADGAEMTLTKSSGNLLVNDANLSIYGQDAGTGKLTIEVSANETNVGGSVAINGGVVEVSCKNDDGVCSGIAGNVTLNWTRNTNRIKADTYGDSKVTIAEGKFFFDGENKAYSGKLSKEQISAIAKKTLKPTIPVKYIDADGSEQTLYDYTVLTGCLNTLEEPKKCEETKLASGQWYVVDGIVRYEGELSSAGSIHLVLKDGAKLTVDDDVYVSGEDGLTAEINIYGQSGGMGELIAKSLADYSGNIIFNGGKATINEGIKVAGKYTMNGGEVTANCAIAKQDVMLLGFGIVGSFITINGGILNSTSCVSDDSGGKLFVAIVGEAAVEINGGTVNLAASSYGISGSSVSINGGNVSIKNAKNGVSGVNVSIMGGNVVMDGNVDSFSAFPGGDVNPITLGWTNSTDSLKTSGFAGPVTIAEGKYFTDGEGYVYSGEIAYSEENGTVLDGKTLKPCYAVTLDAQNGNTPTMIPAIFDENGNTYVTVPAAPSRSGYKFLGWFTTKDGDTEFDFRAPVTASVTVYARWVENIPIEYVDENGETQSIAEYIELTSVTDVSNLPSGWYAVLGKVNFTNKIVFGGDAHLILADGAEMNVNVTSGVAFDAIIDLTIYGQSGQSGALNISHMNGYALSVGHFLTINGGNVTATGGKDGINCNSVTINGGNITATGGNYGIFGNSVTINGGYVTATGDNGISGYNGSVTINGGNVTASGGEYGIYGYDVYLDWTNSTDRIKASSYCSFSGFITIVMNTLFKDENGNVYRDKIAYDRAVSGTALDGKTLVPPSFNGKFLSDVNIAVADIPVQKYADGKPVCPSVLVTDGKDTLKAGTDYWVACFNNTDVTSATLDEAAVAQIIGMGNFAGEIQKHFYIWKNIGNYAAVQVFEDRDGGTHAEIDGAYDGTDAVAIDEDIAVDTVVFNRNFTVDLEKGGFSTLMLPFSVSTEDVGGLGGVYMFAYVADCDGDKKNDVCISKVWEDSDTKHQTLEAYPPYMVRMKESTLKINKNVTLVKTSGGTVYDQRMQTEKAREGSWQMRGVFGYKKWACNDDELGKVWGYTGEPRDGQKIGKYMKLGKGVWINPFRAYLFDPDGEQLKCTDESNTDGSKPQPIAASPYAKAYTADFLPAPAKSAANATASSEMASLDGFGGMQVVLIDGESGKSIAGGKGTTAVGRKSSAATKPSMQPRTKQSYDLKGRRVGKGKKAKGAYYRK